MQIIRINGKNLGSRLVSFYVCTVTLPKQPLELPLRETVEIRDLVTSPINKY